MDVVPTNGHSMSLNRDYTIQIVLLTKVIKCRRVQYGYYTEKLGNVELCSTANEIHSASHSKQYYCLIFRTKEDHKPIHKMAHYAPRLQVETKCHTAYTGQRNHEQSETTRCPDSNQPITTGLHRYYLSQYTGLQKTQKTTVLLTYKGSNTTDKTVLPRNRKKKYFLLIWA
jgi:dTDP-4-amino-4,6-dideoxygalactose transaminase